MANRVQIYIYAYMFFSSFMFLRFVFSSDKSETKTDKRTNYIRIGSQAKVKKSEI